jgi:DNA helicase-2/ATP-dependent DNA helicase PcrA
MDVTQILDSLNEPQRQAVCGDAGHQLVLAGAGSGKTRVLVHRIAWLVRTEGVSPQGVLAVTFTNKAAREMRSRIEELLEISTRGMWVGTFHGLAHRLLKAHWRDAGLPQAFQILDADDQLRVIKRVMRALDIDDSKWPPRQAQWFINAQKDEGRRAGHVEDWGDPYARTMLQIYRAYEEQCELSGMVDFGELLLRTHELWLNHPQTLQHYQRRFQFILVDEFQDTNTIQYAWLRVLAGNASAVTAVGDDDQSIYGWRGAKIENIQQFSKDFPAAAVVRLEQNYRSTANILNAANALIQHNANRLGKELWTDGEEGELISLYAGFNEVDEANFIVSRIESWVAGGRQRAECAILYRSNAQSRSLEDALLRSAIPYRVYGGQRFYDRLEIRNALAYMRLLLNRDDDAAIERVINTPTRGIGEKTLQQLRLYAREHQVSLWRSIAEVLQTSRLTKRAGSALQQFVELIDQLDSDTRELSLHELTDHAISASGLLDFHRNEKGERGMTRVENLEELVSAARAFEWDEQQDSSHLQQLLDSAALDAGERQAGEHEDSVQLMTLHSAKGLEFPMVFLAGVEENLFPHRMSIEEPGRLEEERRLCYVGITRAMEQLCITYAESRRLHGKDNFNAPSRFIREIPVSLLQQVRLGGSVSLPVAPSSMTAMPAGNIALGQRVSHPVFGEGTVLQLEGQGQHARIQVNFDGEGAKWLVMQYAKLEPLV